MPGPVFNLLARRRCKVKLLSMGYSRAAVNDVIDDLDDDTIQATYAATAGVAALGDGEILRKIIEWFSSEQGQAFIKALLDILLALLAGL